MAKPNPDKTGNANNTRRIGESSGENQKGNTSKTSRSIEISRNGIRTASDFASVMAALMSDVLEERVTPRVANAVCNAGGKLLKVVDMQLRYGKPISSTSSIKTLELLAPE